MAFGRGYNKVLRISEEGWVEVDISTRKYPDAVMLLDTADWEYINSIGRVSLGKNGYPRVCVGSEVNKYVHRLLCPDFSIVDHANRHKYDNRRANLREATMAENTVNCKLSEANTSGVTGVYWDAGTQKWAATLRGKRLGRFKDFDDAVTCRLEAEARMLGDFAPHRNDGEMGSIPARTGTCDSERESDQS